MEYLYDSLDTASANTHGRLLVAYDRYGFTVKQWDENTLEEADHPFLYSEGFYGLADVLKLARGKHGRLKSRIVSACCDLMSRFGGSSDSYGEVPDTQTVYDCGHLRRW